MQKRFNDTGLCIHHRHYMVDTSPKLEQVIQMVEFGEYFTINRPRQFGKTTTLYLLNTHLNQRDNYLVLEISFEGIDTETHRNPTLFIPEILMLIAEELIRRSHSEIGHWLKTVRSTITTLPDLSRIISDLVRKLPDRAWVLMIDEVDKSANHQLFFDFLGLLRTKYLVRDRGPDKTFHAVILAGVHDIKTLKQKIRPDSTASYNSPWNIAVDFKVDLSFSPPEIETMLQGYAQDKQVTMDQSAIAERLYHYTSGYPYLVSKLCKFIDEEIVPERADKNWSVADVEAAFKMIVNDAYTTTLFDSLGKNLEYNSELYEFVFQIAINGERAPFAIIDPVVNLGHLYGILAPTETGYCRIHNRIFEQRIYGYMMSKALRAGRRPVDGFSGPDFFSADGFGLDVALILRRFQAFMQEHYSDREAKFLEKEGRLLFLAYLRPIINGKGFEFKEPAVADERRMDIVITYQTQRYVIELKRWHGPAYHQRGLQQLSDYLDSYGLKTGYLLIYDFSKNKSYRESVIHFQDKEIFAVWV